jgi:hypothetical protein
MNPSTHFCERSSEQEPFEHLIDCYRMWVEDQYVFHGNIVGLYNGRHPSYNFQEFLKKAENAGILPAWWNGEKRSQCGRVARNSEDFNINHDVEKHNSH